MTPAAPSRKDVLAASSPWLAAALNGLPGLGTGYIYQRRWGPYWITVALAALTIGVVALFKGSTDVEWAMGNPIPALLGLAAITATEAFLAGRRARME